MEFSSAIYRGDPCPEFSFSFKSFLLVSFIEIFMVASGRCFFDIFVGLFLCDWVFFVVLFMLLINFGVLF